MLALVFKFLLAVLYPGLVYWGLSRGVPLRFLTIPLLIAVAGQIAGQSALALRLVWLVLAVLLSLGLGVYQNPLFLKLYPALISLLFLGAFGLSLSGGESIIEKFARRSGAPLDNRARAYCRKVTLCWCAFFVFNLLMSLTSAFFLPLEWWTLYNGLIAYLLMGCLFAGEWLVRRQVSQRP
ncbi:MAG: hypothetical protein LBQ83_00110 [Candidatus Margulisbacteria bacterium]|nr:hypothetical protein [Candidatus Margulisiibacteriota bacterium]